MVDRARPVIAEIGLQMTFSPAALAEAIERSGMSKTELARRLAGSDEFSRINNARHKIRLYVEGRRTPTEATVAKLAEAICRDAAEADRLRMFRLLGLDQVTRIVGGDV